MKNIVNLLRNKIGITLFDIVRKKSVILIGVKEDDIICKCKDSKQVIHYTSNGTLDGFPNGMQILKPSGNMFDWRKLAWKRGDVLINSAGFKVLFNSWADDSYSGFFAKADNCLGEGIWYETDEYTLASEKDSKNFIAEVEKNLGGKLNLKTLTIDKQPKFKDGDIVHLQRKNWSYIFILRGNNPSLKAYVSLRCQEGIIDYDTDGVYKSSDIFRLATKSEEQQLYTALKSVGKVWDAKRKAIIDLPKTYNFKPLDYFLARYRFNVNSSWNLSQYAHEDDEGYLHLVNGKAIKMFDYDIIPFNEQTKRLLGTTEEYKE